MTTTVFKRLALISALAAVATVAQAESRLSASAGAGAISATAKVNINVTVPRILYLRVGTAGAQTDTVKFAVGAAGLTGALPADAVFAGAVPLGAGTVTTTDTQTGTGQGVISAQLWTNTGTATLGCTSTNIAAGTVLLPKADFKVTSAGGTLPHPGGDLACGGTPISVGAAGGAGAFASDWTYSYTPSALPPAGTYTGTVTYTATQP